MLQFQGEDFIVINIDDVKKKGCVKVKNARINRFREKLRKNGIIYDLGAREFETLHFRYPGNISIGNQSIDIVRSDSFVQVFEQRKDERATQLGSITAIWKSTR